MKEIVYKGKNREDVATTFGDIIANTYGAILELNKVKNKDDPDEVVLWQEKIDREIPIVKRNVKKKILQFLKGRKLTGIINLYCTGSVLTISTDTGFYDRILEEMDISFRNYMPINIVYYVDRKEMTISKESIAN